MAIPNDICVLIDTIASIIGATYSLHEGNIVFQQVTQDKHISTRVRLITTVSEIEGIISTVKNKKSDNGIRLYDNQSYEVGVRVHRLGGHYDPETEDLSFRKADPVEGISYSLSRPSNDYIIHLIQKHDDPGALHGILHTGKKWEDLGESCGDNSEQVSVFELLWGHKDFRTLQIEYNPGDDEGRVSLPVEEFEALAASLLFQLSYNLDLAVTEIRHFDDILRYFFFVKDSFRSVNLSEIEPPKRRCIPELVYFYQAALSSDSHAAQFLSFYHVAEYFFEAVFLNHSIKAVRDTIILTTEEVSQVVEKHIEGLLATNPSLIRHSVTSVKRQVETDEGRIDLLLDTKSGHITVIEVKLHRIGRDAVKQLRNYMKWVRKGRQKQSVSGVLVCEGVLPAFTEDLVKLKDIKVMCYGWQLKLRQWP